MPLDKVSYCGFVAIVGRPNVGKSTLLNKLLAKKLSITSRKPQTTRHRIMGIDTKENYQVIYIDTPGLCIEEKKTINRLMNKSATSSLGEVELIIFVVEGTHWTKDDQMVFDRLKNGTIPVLLVINKIDNIIDKKRILPYIDKLNSQMDFLDVIPVSAKRGEGISTIAELIKKHLPEGPHHFPSNYTTNRSRNFIASEIIREKLTRFLGDELPYSVAVEIERFVVNNNDGYDIHGLIFVERESQKKIVIGKKGMKIKQIGIEARRDMQIFFGRKVHLELWIRVKHQWADDERALNALGYSDNL